MKKRFFVTLFINLIFLSQNCASEEKYSAKYDSVDFAGIIASDRLLKNYVNCLLDKGKCTPEGNDLKKILPEALENNCEKCTTIQRNGVFSIIKHLVQNKRNWWDQLAAKYDPHGTYWEKFKDEWEKEGIIIH